MTMWQELRKKYTDYTQTDIAKLVYKKKQDIYRYENGKIRMPIDIQIMYLKFRNNQYDKIIIKHLENVKELEK